MSESQILDHSNSQLITINLGNSKLQNGTFKLIHMIDLGLYSNITEHLEEIVKTKIATNHPFYPILTTELSQIKNYINQLNIKKNLKNKRSIDIIGTAWKWIAGSPDHHDYNILVDKVNTVLGNNNDQVLINKLTRQRINEITNITNEILKLFKSYKNVYNEIAFKLKFKLELIKEELLNVAYAIHWAKANIINSFILSNNEIMVTEQIMKKNDIPYINIDEALEFAEIKIATDSKSLIYIVSLPTVYSNNCERILLKAVKKGNKIIKLNFNSILSCNNKIYGIKNSCKNYNKLSICSTKNLLEITNSICIPNLLQSQTANCTEINNQHFPSVEEITPGLLFLNQYNGPITIDNKTLNLKGTYILRYRNSTIQADGTTFSLKEFTSSNALPAILQLASTPSKNEEILSLEMLKQLHLNDSTHIKLLDRQNKINLSINIGLTSVIVLTVIAIAIYHTLLRKPSKINITIKENTKGKDIKKDLQPEHKTPITLTLDVFQNCLPIPTIVGDRL